MFDFLHFQGEISFTASKFINIYKKWNYVVLLRDIKDISSYMDKAALKGQSGQIKTEGEWSIGKANSVLQTFRKLKKAWLT
jgi:hypothetical protein